MKRRTPQFIVERRKITTAPRPKPKPAPERKTVRAAIALHRPIEGAPRLRSSRWAEFDQADPDLEE